jgi:hypothetical protein
MRFDLQLGALADELEYRHPEDRRFRLETSCAKGIDEAATVSRALSRTHEVTTGDMMRFASTDHE